MIPHLSPARRSSRFGHTSMLAWPAWLRLLAVCPAVVLLWLAVVWAQPGLVAW